MREFEQALKRARTTEKNPSGLHNDPNAQELLEPHTTPKIEGVGTGAVDSLQDLKAHKDFSVSPLTSLTSEPEEPSFGQNELPILQTNIEYFQDNFGASTSDARNVNGAFRILRTQVLNAMQDRGARILGITSHAPGAGKTITSIHLALACARRAEQRVVLADFDFRRPSVAQYLDASGFRASVGYFQGNGNIMDYVSTNETGNLQFLLTDRSSDMSAEFIASSRMDEALDTLSRGMEDTIIITDLPPLSGCDDTLAMLPKLDGLILVVAAGETNFKDLERTIGMLPKDKIVATVLNKMDGPAVQ
ncbi:MAG: CpsD/CapB family tyrosine-protein kinase, partial [Pseudomonadota bacterium]